MKHWLLALTHDIFCYALTFRIHLYVALSFHVAGVVFVVAVVHNSDAVVAVVVVVDIVVVVVDIVVVVVGIFVVVHYCDYYGDYYTGAVELHSESLELRVQ
jgi:hypothetical protein